MTAYRATRCTCKYAVEIYAQRGRLSSTFYPYERALRTSSDRNLCLAATRSEWELGCYTLSPPFFSSPRNAAKRARYRAWYRPFRPIRIATFDIPFRMSEIRDIPSSYLPSKRALLFNPFWLHLVRRNCLKRRIIIICCFLIFNRFRKYVFNSDIWENLLEEKIRGDDIKLFHYFNRKRSGGMRGVFYYIY